MTSNFTAMDDVPLNSSSSDEPEKKRRFKLSCEFSEHDALNQARNNHATEVTTVKVEVLCKGTLSLLTDPMFEHETQRISSHMFESKLIQFG